MFPTFADKIYYPGRKFVQVRYPAGVNVNFWEYSPCHTYLVLLYELLYIRKLPPRNR